MCVVFRSAIEVEAAFAILLIVFHLTYVEPPIWIEHLSNTRGAIIVELTFESLTRSFEEDAVSILLEVLHLPEIDASVAVDKSAELSTATIFKNSFVMSPIIESKLTFAMEEIVSKVAIVF